MNKIDKYRDIILNVVRNCNFIVKYSSDTEFLAQLKGDYGTYIKFDDKEFCISIDAHKDEDCRGRVFISINSEDMNFKYENSNREFYLDILNKGIKIVRFNLLTNSIKVFFTINTDSTSTTTSMLISKR